MSSELTLPALQSRPWELVLGEVWRKLGALAMAAIGAALFIWQLKHRALLFGFLLSARDGQVRVQQRQARHELVLIAWVCLVPAMALAARELARVRRQRAAGPVHRELLVCSLAAIPPLTLPSIEVEHPYFTALLVLWLAAAAAWATGREFARFPAHWARLAEPSAKRAGLLVGGGFALFVGAIGFLSHWRYLTFHSQVCDMSFEVNAVWGIVKHGLPMNSVGAFMYGDKPLPQPYLNNHTPYVYYLFAPFYALFPDGRTLLWLQAAFMGSGSIGVYLFAQRWLGGRLLGVLASWLYVLNPNIQSYCLHDLHANILAIPCVLLALGLMEIGKPRWALLAGVATVLCREETPLYAAGLALYWMFSSPDRARVRVGLGLLAFSGVWLVVNSRLIMAAYGGHPRWEHFSLFFDRDASLDSAGRALLLNPVGAAYGFVDALSVPYVVYCLLPCGFLALWSGRAVWLGLGAAALMLTSGSPGFYCPGMNYSAPIMPAAIVMGVGGWRRWLDRPRQATAAERPFHQRAAVCAYVLVAGVASSYLYGNIASKGYQLEYGYSPLRRQNDYSRADMAGWVTALPPYGEQEKALWQALEHVPRAVPVASSWAVNPQLSDREVALTLDYSLPNAETRVNWIVIDKLPMMQVPTERLLNRFRRDDAFQLRFENRAAAVFERKVAIHAG